MSTPSLQSAEAQPIAPPADMAALPVWHPWTYGPGRPGKNRVKLPLSIVGGVATSVANLGALDYANAYVHRPVDAGMACALGPVDGRDFAIIGGDLDACRNPDTAEIAGWAQGVLDTFVSYAEVSPSGTGLKIFATISTEDLAAIREKIAASKGLNGSHDSKIWKWKSEDEHGPAIELFMSKRWFAFTGLHVFGPHEFRKLDMARITDLIERIGPDFAAADPSLGALPPRITMPAAANDADRSADFEPMDLAALQADLRGRVEAAAARSPELRDRLAGRFGGKDRSGSGRKIALIGAAKRASLEQEDAFDLARAHPATTESVEKEGERGLERAWAKAGEAEFVDPAEAFAHVVPLAEPSGLTERRGMQRRKLSAIRTLPPLRWLVPGYITAEGIIFIAGAPKSGKTFITLYLAAALAAGAPWAGIDTAGSSPGLGVVYWAGEGLGGLGERAAALGDIYGFDIDEEIDVLTGAFSAPAVIEACRADPPAVLIIDTWARATAGLDEMSARDMSAAIEGLDHIRAALGCLVIVVHHFGKDTTRGLRGSSVLLGAADAVFSVTRLPSGVMAFEAMALKEAEEPAAIFFDLKKVGSSACAVLSERAAGSSPGGEGSTSLSPVERMAIFVLKNVIDHRSKALTDASTEQSVVTRSATLSERGTPGIGAVAVPLLEWREAFHAGRPDFTREVNARALKRAQEALKNKGLTSVTGEWVRLTVLAAPVLAQGVGR